ncbi:MAG: winged helix-turn-helix transcriptional regulator [Alphaproteobacteria bacterium]|nr:winged helix-turn-helix transcriptional regulator [Alphaproteobacteria bacterium]
MTVYSFRNFVFEPETGKLLAGGVPVPLGVTESRLLHTLLEKPGSVLRKDELISSVWGRAIVSDNALHVHIAGLRKLLGDDAVFTKRGVGYRFALEVSCHSSRSILGNLVHGEPRGVADSTFLIGRERELREISSLLRTARLMTLMGAGGVGNKSGRARRGRSGRPFPGRRMARRTLAPQGHGPHSSSNCGRPRPWPWEDSQSTADLG